MTTQQDYDCAILGSGIGGSMLASILARHGRSVLLVDAGTHPRFAIGEATTPDTSFRMKLLSMKYDVPEILNLSTFHKLRDHVSPACGVKRAFSFLYHRDGEEQTPEESHQYPTLAPPMGPDCHLFRQDTDAYMMSVAVGYGATIRQQCRIESITFPDDPAEAGSGTEEGSGDDRVTLMSAAGETFRARYLVDAAGFRSPLAQQFDLRDAPDRVETNSRAIFTHMLGVEHYDALFEGAGGQESSRYGLKYPLSQSTLHHVFEGGWFWVIPFNNHDDSTNPLCSVGLMLNRELHPETGMDPEEEFFSFVERFPSMRRQFENARAVRGWVSTGRVGYSSRQLVGDRYCLLAHAAGFIDPLFSSGLNLTTSHVDILARHLLEAFDDGDFSAARFRPVEERFRNSFRVFDEVVASSFVSFRDYELWDAWFRVWVVGLLVSTCLNAKLYLRYLETGDPAVLEESNHPPYTGALGTELGYFKAYYENALEIIRQVRDGELEPKPAAKALRKIWRHAHVVPTTWDWSNPQVRTTPAFTVWGVTKLYFWYRLRAPRSIDRALFGWSPITAYRYILRSIWEISRSSTRRRRQYVRDVFKAWNRDWSREAN